ncbi:U3 small nucleolar RNA-associated protein 4 [Rhizophlyctis rosea]|uniref:U3 small nucleolar RNA-associated protein 4 n=1 Tax=Rhizophlyctis rosea TaxID=64517 RepID=A0AAD5SFE6_9FUNG|nr:U3 small nucleolar RNA-associated protein 4 [Rhizophlyctis rosea]
MATETEKQRDVPRDRERGGRRRTGAGAKSSLVIHRCRTVHYTPAGIVSLSFTPETVGKKRMLACARANGDIELWCPSVSRWHLERTIPGRPKAPVETVLWTHQTTIDEASFADQMDEDDTPESRETHIKHLRSLPPRLFSTSLDGRIVEWDITSLQPKQTMESNGGAIWCMVANSAHTRLAVGCEDGFVRIYNIADGSLEFLKFFERQEGRIMSLAWFNGVSGEFVAAGGADGVIRKFDYGTGKVARRMLVDKARGGEDTIVWDLAVLKDGTIVAGDSLGNVSFWNSTTGVVFRTMRTHEADVLALVVNKEGTEIFSTGVDRNVVRLSLLNQKKASGIRRKEWVISGKKRYHSHDVRALCLIEEKPHNALVSGGIDTNLIVSIPLVEFPHVKQYRMPLFPHRSVVSLARGARLLMCQFSDHVKVWKLATPVLPAESLARLRQFEQLDYQKESLLFNIKPKCSTNLIASAISDDGKWVVVSDMDCVKLFSITVKRADNIYTVKKVKTFPSPTHIPSASTLAFTPDSNRLIIAGTNSTIYIVNLSQASAGVFETEQKFEEHRGVVDADGVDEYEKSRRRSGGKGGKELVMWVCVSNDGQWLASGDLANRINVFSLDSLRHHATLPIFSSQHTSLTFHPISATLIVTCVSNEFFLYDCEEARLSDWSREYSHRLPLRWLYSKNLTMGSCVGENKPGVVALWGSETLCFVDLEKPLGAPDAAISRVQRTAVQMAERNTARRKKTRSKANQSGESEDDKQSGGDPMVTSGDEVKRNGTTASGETSDGVILISSGEESGDDESEAEDGVVNGFGEEGLVNGLVVHSAVGGKRGRDALGVSGVGGPNHVGLGDGMLSGMVPGSQLGRATTYSEAFLMETRYHPIMFAGFVGANEMVIVERPVLKVYEELPEAFYKHEFQF